MIAIAPAPIHFHLQSPSHQLHFISRALHQFRSISVLSCRHWKCSRAYCHHLKTLPVPIDRNLDTLLSQAQVAINNALNNPKVLEYLSDFGYTSVVALDAIAFQPYTAADVPYKADTSQELFSAAVS